MEGKVYHGVSVPEDANSVPIEEYIRQLVKEEVAAQLSQMQAKSITIDPVAVGEAARRYIDNYVRQPLSKVEADSQNKTWESAKNIVWNGETLEVDRDIPRLKILGDEVFINNRMIPYVTGYELKRQDLASRLAELTLKVAVETSDMVIDTGTNYVNSDLSKGTQGE